MTPRRLLWAVPVILVLAAAVYTAWLAWQVQGELRAAESSASDLQAAWRSDDGPAQDRAATNLADQAAAAHDHTAGVWWRGLSHLPLVGDDATGVATMSESLDLIANEAVGPLSDAVDGLGGLMSNGRIDLERVSAMQEPLGRADQALRTADDDLSGLDSSGYISALRTRFDRYAGLVSSLRSGIDSADKAVAVLPEMAGANGPTNYLLIFQNNAEIRPTGGMPGSWALLHADDGKVDMTRQGAATDFPMTTKPVLPLTKAEVAVYGKQLGIFFQDPGFTPDFPRAAELWHAHWDLRFPQTPIDGVVAVDPVGMSYLLRGTGPVKVGNVTLTSDNAVEELLSKPYIEAGPAAQNVFFSKASKAIFAAATDSLASPIAFAEGLNRSASEGRLLISSFDKDVSDQLAGTRVEGALAGDDGRIPHVDVTFSDLTGSKMSYYLRYNADMEATSCAAGVQRLAGTVTMNQVIAPSQAAALPVSVTGGGKYGTDAGSQFLMVRIYGSYGGAVAQVRLNGRTLKHVEAERLDGRPVVNIDVLLSSRKDVVLTWQGTTAAGQTGDGQLSTTPSIVPGSDVQTFKSAC